MCLTINTWFTFIGSIFFTTVRPAVATGSAGGQAGWKQTRPGPAPNAAQNAKSASSARNVRQYKAIVALATYGKVDTLLWHLVVPPSF